MDNKTIKYTNKIINYDSYFEKNKKDILDLWRYNM